MLHTYILKEVKFPFKFNITQCNYVIYEILETSKTVINSGGKIIYFYLTIECDLKFKSD